MILPRRQVAAFTTGTIIITKHVTCLRLPAPNHCRSDYIHPLNTKAVLTGTHISHLCARLHPLPINQTNIVLSSNVTWMTEWHSLDYVPE